MSFDPGRSTSPTSSETSQRAPALRPAREDDLKKDKGYRRYASNVERALSLFDTALQEWADYISFLSRLLKALQSHPPSLSVVPNKILVAKRLAQCLNPTLPSGVHQKALEVYEYIFSLLKPDGLARDLPLYLPGIAPTLTFASLSVRPAFLSLVESYILNLNPIHLRPALKAIILALLPGLEEETSDDFETTLRIVDKLRKSTSGLSPRSDSSDGGRYFWQCLFLASVTNPTRRMGVLAYLNRHLPKLGGNNPWATLLKETLDAELAELSVPMDSLTSPEPGLLIRCFATGLSDDQVLVQRNFLDLLVTNIPLHSPVLQKRITDKDLRLLVSAATGVVARRDMSLNRRLWAWLLGPDSANGTQENDSSNTRSPVAGPAADSVFDNETSKSKYFAHFGWRPLVDSIQAMIKCEPSAPNERSRPFRISLSLMDRWEVGGLVVPEIFLPVMRSVQKYRQSAHSNAQFEEVFRSASAFFDGVESSLIFSELVALLRLESSGTKTLSAGFVDDLRLTNFIVSHFNMREEEMQVVHIPVLILASLLKLQSISSMMQDRSDYANMRQIALDEISSIINRLLNLVPSRAFTRTVHGTDEDMTTANIQHAKICNRIHDFYKRSKESLEPLPPPFLPGEMAELLLGQAHSLLLSAVESETQLTERLNLLVTLLGKSPRTNILNEGLLFETMYEKLKVADSASDLLPFQVVSSITTSLTSLYSIHAAGLYISYEQICDIIPRLCGQLWEYLSPSNLKFHVEAVQCIWLLHSVTWHRHLVEASIASYMVAQSASKPLHITSKDQVDRFFILWNHSHQVHVDYTMFRGRNHHHRSGSELEDAKAEYQSSLLDRPLFIVLDQLSLGPDSAASTVKEWLHDLSSVGKIFRTIISKLGELSVWKQRDGKVSADHATSNPANDANQCHYLFRTISNVMSSLGPAGWSALTASPAADSEGTEKTQESAEVSSAQLIIAETAMMVLNRDKSITGDAQSHVQRMLFEVLSVLKQLISGPGALNLVHLNLDKFLIDQLSLMLDHGECILQEVMIDALLPALKVRFSHDASEMPDGSQRHRRKSSLDALASFPRLSFSAEKSENEATQPVAPLPNPQLLHCLLKGISSRSSRDVIDKWIKLLSECLPLYSSSIFQILLTLVETFCKEINIAYQELQRMFRPSDASTNERSEHVTVALLTGLENCIATAHERLLLEEANVPVAKSPDQQQSFFGNMVSGVFSGEAAQSRNATASNRLTVLLCFQDAVRLCFSIWSWGNNGRSRNPIEPNTVASFQYTSLRMRNRSRRMLEHLFTAEPLECLETLIQIWRHSITLEDPTESRLIFSLLHTLNESRPKVTVPAIFNAIYSRTNPSALEPSRQSAMASQLSETDLAAFLVTYARSLEDDMMDEIWSDCTTFLRDVLGNPFPHRQILLRLLEFAAILGNKMENTSFGDDRRTRKELGDLLLRILTAISTSKPMGLQEASATKSAPRNEVSEVAGGQQMIVPDDILSILSAIMPSLSTTLSDSDRLGSAMSGISVNVISPMFHFRLFPQNVSRAALDLVQQMSRIPSASKQWRKDVGDAFNDSKFFGTEAELVQSYWLDILRQWVMADKERMTDLLSRLTTPSTAGIMFGVGASAARLEADRKTQLNLRRIAVLVLASDEDHFSSELATLQQKLEDILTATHESSPSSATRAEIYMVLRAIVLRTSAIHLAPFWPMINTELREVISAVSPDQPSETYNSYSLLQGCKLLETLRVISPDDFQLQEWLFLTDTVDIVYPPDRWETIALADEVSKTLGTRVSEASSSRTHEQNDDREDGLKRSRLTSDVTRETAKDEIVDKVLRPFFDRLSIHAFESMYRMDVPDVAGCQDDLLADLFNEFTLAS